MRGRERELVHAATEHKGVFKVLSENILLYKNSYIIFSLVYTVDRDRCREKERERRARTLARSLARRPISFLRSRLYFRAERHSAPRVTRTRGRAIFRADSSALISTLVESGYRRKIVLPRNEVDSTTTTILCQARTVTISLFPFFAITIEVSAFVISRYTSLPE